MIFYRYGFLNLDTNKARLVHTTHDIGTLSLWSAQSFMYLLLKVVPEIESTTSECHECPLGRTSRGKGE